MILNDVLRPDYRSSGKLDRSCGCMGNNGELVFYQNEAGDDEQSELE